MFIVDEASGVPDEIFEAIEGTQTQEGVNSSKILLIGNPTRPEGFFFDIFHSKSANWKTFHLDGRLSPRVSKQWISQMETDYGSDSPFFQIHVLGNFPPVDKDTLIPLSWIERALADPKEEGCSAAYTGFDVARMGNDYSVLVSVSHNDNKFTVRQIDFFSKIELMELCGWGVQIFKKIGPEKVMVDVIGVGAGVHDRLKELGYPVVGVNVAESPCRNSEDFKNKKAEMYWNLRGLFERQEIIIPKIQNHAKLVAELSSMKYKYDSSGKLQIVDPENRRTLQMRLHWRVMAP